MIKKIFLSLLLTISFLFLSGFTTLAESKTITQVQEFPNAIIKATYYNVFQFRENADTYEYRVSYYISDVYFNRTVLHDHEYFLITYHNIVLRKGINRNTNSYELVGIIHEPSLESYRITIDVTLLKSFVNDNYASGLDGIRPFFRDNSSLYVIYNIGVGSPDYEAGYDAGYNQGYNDGYNYGHQSGRDEGYYEGYEDGYDEGRDDGYNDGYNSGYNRGYNDGYNAGLNDVNVEDYFGKRNYAKVLGINNHYFTSPFQDGIATLKVVFNFGLSGDQILNYPNITLDQPYMIIIIRKNFYTRLRVNFEDGIIRYHYEAERIDMEDFDVLVFDLSDRLNKKYYLEIYYDNITNYQEFAFRYINIIDTTYFSHTSKKLNSEQALKFYEIGYLAGFEEMIEDNEAYQIGYDNGYERGYYDGDIDGYDRGIEEGYDSGYDKGYTIGNNEGYQNGFRDGYDRGFTDGKTADYDTGYKDGYRDGNEAGYKRGTKDGYQQGASDTFLGDMAKWFGPMVLIVLIAGAYVTLKNRGSGD